MGDADFSYADYADCWWRRASNTRAIDSAGDAWQVLRQIISPPSTHDLLKPFSACVHTVIDAALALQDLFYCQMKNF
jgi:hypothetical protein